ncbi:uncharacterized protein K02A2.6-like [Uranotaenia lowii]|uniref:uncharacterized protein K02A2.6-like n=1 Tax=Uranotaenia lowii TaxID=190385 RepID=UPI002478EAA3|nr:uncharacterized protein K02A2.6-like [Uranotaenia lowii]
MRCKDADSTNAALCEVFKTWGFPRVIQSDNGPPFRSASFINFWETKGVRIDKSIPLSPQSNGLVERHNQAVIKAVAASKLDQTNWRVALHKYVHHHNTLIPHSRLNVTPFELMVGRKFRGTFPSLWNDFNRKVLDRIDIREKDADAKLVSKQYADSARGAKESSIKVGDKVFLAKEKKSKIDPTFSSEKFQVVARQGAKVVVMSPNGIEYERNVRDVKKINCSDSVEFVDPSDENTAEEQPTIDSGELTVAGANQDDIFRNRRNTRRPARFNDQFVYCVFT